jgi:hypothetical protein
MRHWGMRILFFVYIKVPEYKHSALNYCIFTFTAMRLAGNNDPKIESITGSIIYRPDDCDTAREGAKL